MKKFLSFCKIHNSLDLLVTYPKALEMHFCVDQFFSTKLYEFFSARSRNIITRNGDGYQSFSTKLYQFIERF